MTVKLLSADEFRAAARGGSRPAGAVLRVNVADPIPIDGGRKIRFCFSDASIDRAGDSINPNGWDVASFLKNPVALFAHNSWEPPVGRAGDVQVEAERLMGTIEFAEAAVYPFAETIYQLVKNKFLNATSVGFLPTKWSYVDDETRRFGIDFEKQELLEISIVPVPCNPNALGEARAKGIDTRPLVAWAEKVLDGGGKIALPRAELERLRRAAKEPARRDPSGLGETDPAGGGALLATCARAADDECGLKDPQECAVHRVDDEGDKTMTIDEIRKLLRAELRKLGPGAGRRRSEPDDDEGDAPGDGQLPEDHEKSIRAAHAHVKAAGALYEAADGHHEEALKCLGKAVDDIDDPEAEGKGDDGAGDDDGDELPEEHVRAAHEHMKSAADLCDQAEEHHDKAEALLGAAVDHFDNPEAEGDGKAQRRARARARRAARHHRSDAAA